MTAQAAAALASVLTPDIVQVLGGPGGATGISVTALTNLGDQGRRAVGDFPSPLAPLSSLDDIDDPEDVIAAIRGLGLATQSATSSSIPLTTITDLLVRRTGRSVTGVRSMAWDLWTEIEDHDVAAFVGAVEEAMKARSRGGWKAAESLILKAWSLAESAMRAAADAPFMAGFAFDSILRAFPMRNIPWARYVAMTGRLPRTADGRPIIPRGVGRTGVGSGDFMRAKRDRSVDKSDDGSSGMYEGSTVRMLKGPLPYADDDDFRNQFRALQESLLGEIVDEDVAHDIHPIDASRDPILRDSMLWSDEDVSAMSREARQLAIILGTVARPVSQEQSANGWVLIAKKLSAYKRARPFGAATSHSAEEGSPNWGNIIRSGMQVVGGVLSGVMPAAAPIVQGLTGLASAFIPGGGAPGAEPVASTRMPLIGPPRDEPAPSAPTGFSPSDSARVIGSSALSGLSVLPPDVLAAVEAVMQGKTPSRQSLLPVMRLLTGGPTPSQLVEAGGPNVRNLDDKQRALGAFSEALLPGRSYQSQSSRDAARADWRRLRTAYDETMDALISARERGDALASELEASVPVLRQQLADAEARLREVEGGANVNLAILSEQLAATKADRDRLVAELDREREEARQRAQASSQAYGALVPPSTHHGAPPTFYQHVMPQVQAHHWPGMGLTSPQQFHPQQFPSYDPWAGIPLHPLPAHHASAPTAAQPSSGWEQMIGMF
jgi:hypothetical protein